MNNLIKISNLISASVLRDLTVEEQTVLDYWLNDDESHRILYKKICDSRNIKDRFKEKQQIDYIASYLKVEESIAYRRRRKTIVNWFQYAAVIFLPLLLGLFVVLTKSNDIPTKAYACNIKAGEYKAMLVLDDGSRIDVSNNVEDTLFRQKGLNILSDNSTVKYDAVYNGSHTDKKAKEIKYNTLVVPRGGEYNLVLCDGTKVRLNSESSIKYPVHFSEKTRKVFLTGEAYFDVAKNKLKPFVINVDGSFVKVLGTSFNLRAYPNENNIETTLVEGSVELKSKSNKSTILSPGYQGVIDEYGNVSAKEVDISLYTSWIDGCLKFKHQRLEDIMNVLFRWYDINIFYMNSAVKDIEYSGTLKRYQSFEDVINFLELTGAVEFEVKGNSVIIKEVYSR